MNLLDVNIRQMQKAAAILMYRLSKLEGEQPAKGILVQVPWEELLRDCSRLKSVSLSEQSEDKGIRAIYSILRQHVINPTGSKDRILGHDLRILKNILDTPIIGISAIAVDEEHREFGEAVEVVDEGKETWYLQVIETPLRKVANALVEYLYFFSNSEYLKHDPIRACLRCGSLYLKVKSSQDYCSANCRVAAWGKKKGKDYFKEKQAEFRASLKAQTEELKKKEGQLKKKRPQR